MDVSIVFRAMAYGDIGMHYPLFTVTTSTVYQHM